MDARVSEIKVYARLYEMQYYIAIVLYSLCGYRQRDTDLVNDGCSSYE